MDRRWIIVVGGLFVALLASNVTAAQTPVGREDRLQVIAPFSILGDLVQQVGGDDIELVTVIAPGADAHTFDPNPDQARAIAEADLIFEIGLGFDPWLDPLYESSASSAQRVVVTDSDGITLIDGAADSHEDEAAEADDHGDEGEDGHDHGDADPHVWHDVMNAMHMVEAIRDALSAADPARAEVYQANAGGHLAELQELDAFIVEQVASLPEERRQLVTAHDTFAYFAQRYGFEVVGTVLGVFSTEGADPSAREMATLVEEIEAAGVPAIFPETVSNADLMEAIAAEAGVEVAPALYTDALGEPGSEGDTYIGMMQYNTSVIVDALGQ